MQSICITDTEQSSCHQVDHYRTTMNQQSLPQLLDNILASVPAGRREELRARFEQHSPLCLDRLQRLYGLSPGYFTWLHEFMRNLVELATARPDDLCELDRRREQQPDWFLTQRQIGYCAYADRLGGTLAGVRKTIPHLQQLGVTYLHLLPFLRARDGENDGGFAVAAFDQIEPALGTMDNLTELAYSLRQADISLCSDFILNHVADSHPWASAARAGDTAAQACFYVFNDAQQVADLEDNLNQVFPDAAPGNFTWQPELQAWVWTTFYPYQWDLNYQNPRVFSSMVTAMLNLANHGVEVFRLDSTAYIWKRSGTSCMNQPEVHVILQALRSIVSIVAPAVLLKAEAIVPTAELPAYLGDSSLPECHLAYHSTLMASSWAALTEQNADLVRKVIENTPINNNCVSWLTYVRCHDDIGWNVLLPEASQNHRNGARRLADAAACLTGLHGGFGRGRNFQTGGQARLHGTNGMTASLTGITSADTTLQLDRAFRRMQLLYGLAFSFGGMPLIYMGDEFAQDNDESFAQDPAHANDNRWLQRPVLDAQSFSQRNDLQSVAGQAYHALSSMAGMRRQLPELAADAPRRLLLCADPALLVLLRGSIDVDHPNGVIYLANFSERQIPVDLAELSGILCGLWQNMADNSHYADKFMMPGLSQYWLKPMQITGMKGGV